MWFQLWKKLFNWKRFTNVGRKNLISPNFFSAPNTYSSQKTMFLCKKKMCLQKKPFLAFVCWNPCEEWSRRTENIKNYYWISREVGVSRKVTQLGKWKGAFASMLKDDGQAIFMTLHRVAIFGKFGKSKKINFHKKFFLKQIIWFVCWDGFSQASTTNEQTQLLRAKKKSFLGVMFQSHDKKNNPKTTEFLGSSALHDPQN